MTSMYDLKEKIYFEGVRKDLLDLIPHENRNGNVLEIGAGGGNTLLYAKENRYANNIYAIELFNIKESNQRSESFSGFILGNIEEMDFPFADVKFDAIILGDVLEHLIDPYTLVNKLKKYLTDDGAIISSIPNIREYRTMKKIFFKGDFKYTDSGILDKTHLRFFTKKNMIELFENNGYVVENIVSNDTRSALTFLKKFKFRKLFFKLFMEELLATQYFITAKKRK